MNEFVRFLCLILALVIALPLAAFITVVLFRLIGVLS